MSGLYGPLGAAAGEARGSWSQVALDLGAELLCPPSRGEIDTAPEQDRAMAAAVTLGPLKEVSAAASPAGKLGKMRQDGLGRGGA